MQKGVSPCPRLWINYSSRARQGPQECVHKGMRRPWTGSTLGNEQSPDEEAVLWMLDHANLAFAIASGYAQQSALECGGLTGIRAKIAVIRLGGRQASVDVRDPRSRFKM